MLRRILMFFGVKPVVLLHVTVVELEGEFDIDLIFGCRRWATEEDLAVERAKVLSELRLKLTGSNKGKITHKRVRKSS